MTIASSEQIAELAGFIFGVVLVVTVAVLAMRRSNAKKRGSR